MGRGCTTDIGVAAVRTPCMTPVMLRPIALAVLVAAMGVAPAVCSHGAPALRGGEPGFPSPRAILAKAHESLEGGATGGMTGNQICDVFGTLAALDDRFACRDASGARVPGLNATMLLYHKPFAQQRAAVVRAAAAAAPCLSGKRAASLLRHVCTLAPAGFASTALCRALVERLLERCHALPPRATAVALQACGRLGACDDWLTNALASRALQPAVMAAFGPRDVARAADGVACLQTRQRGQRVLMVLLEALVRRLRTDARLVGRLRRRSDALASLLEALGRLRFCVCVCERERVCVCLYACLH